MKIGIFQMNTSWLEPTANLNQLKEVLKNVEKIDLIILPEMFNTGFCMNPPLSAEEMDGYTIKELLRISKDFDIGIITSIAIIEEGNYFNRFLMIENGLLKSTYDKMHLFSFGKENEHFTAGSENKLIDFKGWKIMPQICYDLRFPEMVRAHDDIDLIVNVANWPKARVHHWNKLLLARAIENQCFVLGCNRTGVDGNRWEFSGESKVIDYDGDVRLNLGGIDQFLAIDLELEKARKNRIDYPFQKDK